MTEPIILGLAPGLITGLILAFANLAKAFGVDITKEQVEAINGVVLPVMLVLFAVGGWWARKHATPTASPTLPEGTEVHVVTPPDQSDRTVTL